MVIIQDFKFKDILINTTMLFHFRVALKPIIYHHSRKSPRKIHTHVIKHTIYENKEKNQLKKPLYKQQILNYFNNDFFKNESKNLSEDLLQKPKKLPPFLYLMNEEIANRIINSINSDLLEGSPYIIEANPGFGFITRHLISLNCGKIKVFEPGSYFEKYMKQLKLEYPDKLDVYGKNLSYYQRFSYKKEDDKKINLKQVIEPLESSEWSDECSVKIIGSCPNARFLRQYVMSIVFQKGFFQLGRPQLFLVLDPKTYSLLNPENNVMKTFPILCKLFFDIDYVLSLDKRDFLPWFELNIKSSKSVRKLIISDLDYLVLVKMTGRKDLFERIGGAENLKSLWFFLTQLCKSSKNRIIPSIEKWVPGCGYRLLLCGLNTFSEIQDLNPEKAVDLFLNFLSWPELPSSSYYSAVESFAEKKETANSLNHEDELALEKDESVRD